MPEYSVELVIRLVAPKPWKKTTVQLVERVLRGEAGKAIDTANRFADGWTQHGEPVTVEVEFREVSR